MKLLQNGKRFFDKIEANFYIISFHRTIQDWENEPKRNGVLPRLSQACALLSDCGGNISRNPCLFYVDVFASCRGSFVLPLVYTIYFIGIYIVANCRYVSTVHCVTLDNQQCGVSADCYCGVYCRIFIE